MGILRAEICEIYKNYFFWILRRRIHHDLISLFEPLCIIRLIGEVNKEDEGITVLMAACHQVLKSSSKKERKKRFSSSVSYFLFLTRSQLMQCLYETRVSNTEWRKSLVRGLSFFLSEIGQVTLKVEPGVCTDSFIFSWSLTIVTIVRQDRSPLLRRQPSSHLSKSSLGRPGVSKYKDKNTICRRSDELYDDTKTASRASLKQKTLRGTLAFTLPSYQATGSNVYFRVY